MQRWIGLMAVLVVELLWANPLELQFQWDPNTEDDVAGYVVSWGPSGHSATVVAFPDSVPHLYPNRKDVGLDTATVLQVSGMQPVYAVVQAYDVSGNVSDPSLEVAWAPLWYYERAPHDSIVTPYDAFIIRNNYGMTPNYYLWDSIYNLNFDNIINPSDMEVFRRNYYGRVIE